ncbi:MAG: DUF3859 domain-containing protein [Chitinophaga rupis]
MKIKHIKLLRSGSLTTSREHIEANERSLSGYFLYPSKIHFLDDKSVLKGAVGLKFGIEYFIEGYDQVTDENEAAFCCRIKHPELSDPVSNERSSETTEKKYNVLNEVNFDYFSIEYEWELKPGTWTFQILEEDNLLLEKSFEII